MAQITQLSTIAVPGRRYGLVVSSTQTLTLVSFAPSILIGQAFSVNTLTLVSSPEPITIIPGEVTVGTLSLTLVSSAEIINVSIDLIVSVSTLVLTSSAEFINISALMIIVAFDVTINQLSEFDLGINQTSIFDLGINQTSIFDLEVNQETIFDLTMERVISFDLEVG